MTSIPLLFGVDAALRIETGNESAGEIGLIMLQAAPASRQPFSATMLMASHYRRFRAVSDGKDRDFFPAPQPNGNCRGGSLTMGTHFPVERWPGPRDCLWDGGYDWGGMGEKISGLNRLRDAVETAHQCKANHIDSVPLREMSGDALVWEGVVERFSLSGHPERICAMRGASQTAKKRGTSLF